MIYEPWSMLQKPGKMCPKNTHYFTGWHPFTKTFSEFTVTNVLGVWTQ